MSFDFVVLPVVRWSFLGLFGKSRVARTRSSGVCFFVVIEIDGWKNKSCTGRYIDESTKELLR